LLLVLTLFIFLILATSYPCVETKQSVVYCRRRTFVNLKVHLSSSFAVIVVYRVSQEEYTKLREGVPYVKLYRYNPKHLYPKLNGYGDKGHRKVWAYGMSTYCTPSVTPYSSNAHAQQQDIVMQ